MADMTTQLEFDPGRPEVRADPYALFRELRRHDPVHWSPALGAWVLTRYDDVKGAVNDPRFSADRISPFRDSLAGDARERIAGLLAVLGDWMVFNDPPRHTRLRALVGKVFTPRVGERLRPFVEQVVDDLIGRIEAAAGGNGNDGGGEGRLDLIREFGYPLPVMVIARLLGVPAADQERFKFWSDELATFVGSARDTPDKRDRAEAAIGEMADYFRAQIARRRADPRDDILSALVAAEESGDFLSEAELIGTCTLLLFAGHETTTNLIGNGMLALLRHPEQMRLLAARPELAESAVEELLRYDGPTPAMARAAREDVALAGGTIRAGDRVFAMLGGANRDPARFDEPEELNLARPDNRHLAFGYGIHFCLGAPLARLEARVAFGALLERLPGLALAGPEPEWIDSVALRGVKSLELVYTPRRGKPA
jgi:cytochrome P450